MEWDLNTPWYRPTRLNHVISGAEFGWRSGAGKWPAYYLDSFGAVLNIGPGSPTGVTFGYGAKFPARYQEALFMRDWSFGKLYAAHLTPEGASCSATAEEFVTGSNKDPFHRKPTDPKPDPALQGRILAALDRIEWSKLGNSDRLDGGRNPGPGGVSSLARRSEQQSVSLSWVRHSTIHVSLATTQR